MDFVDALKIILKIPSTHTLKTDVMVYNVSGGGGDSTYNVYQYDKDGKPVASYVILHNAHNADGGHMTWTKKKSTKAQ